MNYTGLLELAKFLCQFDNILGMHFWGYVPVTKEAAELILPYEPASFYLNETIKFLLTQKRDICVKFFPVCLLDDQYKKYHHNGQPQTLGIIDDFVQKQFNSCGYKHFSCCHGTDCLGIPEIYQALGLSKQWMPSNKR